MTLAVWFALGLSLSANPAAPRPSVKVPTAPPPPVLVMVKTPGNASFEKSQARLHDELALLLDSFVLILSPVDTKDFAKKPLADQLAAVLQISKANDAVAVVWLAEPLPGQMMLHLVAMGTGRTLVRTLEFDRRSQSENVLAIMLRELLGTAFLYEPVTAVPGPVRSLVAQARHSMPAMEELEPPPPEPPHPEQRPRVCVWCARFTGGGLLEAGLGDAYGPSSRFGLTVNGTLWLDPVHLGGAIDVLWLNAVVSPLGVRLSSVSLPLTVVGTWHPFRTNFFEAGPTAAAGLELSWATSKTLAAPVTTATLFSAGPVAALGFEARGKLGVVAVWARVEVYVRTRGQQLLETTSNAVGWKLSTVSARVSLGAGWEGF